MSTRSSPEDEGSPSTALAKLGSPKILGLIVVLAVIHSTLYLQSVIATDGVSYARIAESLATDFSLLRDNLVYTPGYPLLMAPLVRITSNSQLSGELLSLFMTLGSVVLVWRLGGQLFGPAAGSIAAFLLVLSFHFMVQSYYVKSEPTYTFFMLASALLLISLLQRYTHGRAILLGMALLFFYLTRPEGLVPTVAVLAGLACMGAFGRARRPKLLLGAILAGSVVTAGHLAYVIHVHGLTGEWTQNTKLHNNWYVAHRVKLAVEQGIPEDDAYEWVQRGIGDAGQVGTARFAQPRILEEIAADPMYYLDHYLNGTRQELMFLLRAMKLILPLAILGIVLALRDPNRRCRSLFVLAFALPLAVYPFFYIQYRNVGTVMPVLYVFGAAGLLQAFRWCHSAIVARWSSDRRRTMDRIALVGLSILVVGPSVALIVRNRESADTLRLAVVHKVAGQWLKEHSRVDGPVMSRKPWVGFYAGRDNLKLPYGDAQTIVGEAEKRGVSYLVIDSYFTKPETRAALDGTVGATRLQPVFTTEANGNHLVIYKVESSRSP